MIYSGFRRKGSEVHFGGGGVAVDGAVALDAQAAEPVGEGQILLQLAGGESGQSVAGDAVPGQLPQERADEAVSGAGGVHGLDLLALGKGVGGAGVGVSAASAAGVEDQLDVAGEQLGQGGVDVLGAGQEGQLLVRNLEDRGLGHKVQNGLFQGVMVGPEGEPEVGVKADEGSGPGDGLNGGNVGLLHGAFHQGHAAEVEGESVVKPGRVNLLGAVEQVGGGIAVEAEGPVAVGAQGDKGQSGVGLVGKGYPADVDAVAGQFVCNLVAEGIVPQLGQQGRVAAQRGEGAADVGGRAAHPGAESGHFGKGTAALGGDHVNEGFADGKESVTGHWWFLLHGMG